MKQKLTLALVLCGLSFLSTQTSRAAQALAVASNGKWALATDHKTEISAVSAQAIAECKAKGGTDPLQAQIRAQMLQNQQDTQSQIEGYKAEIAKIDKQQRQLNKLSDSYASGIEQEQKDVQELDKRKAELERYSRFLDKLWQQQDQDQQQQPTPQSPTPQSI
jgi:myosin heavy subunit